MELIDFHSHAEFFFSESINPSKILTVITLLRLFCHRTEFRLVPNSIGKVKLKSEYFSYTIFVQAIWLRITRYKKHFPAYGCIHLQARFNPIHRYKAMTPPARHFSRCNSPETMHVATWRQLLPFIAPIYLSVSPCCWCCWWCNNQTDYTIQLYDVIFL